MSLQSSSPVPGRSPALEHTLIINQSLNAGRNHVTWAAINGIIFSLILYHLSETPWRRNKDKLNIWIEIGVGVILFLNTIYHFCAYIKKSFYINPVVVTPKQRKLLGIRKSDPNFINSTTPTSTIAQDLSLGSTGTEFTSMSPMNLSSTSWMSSSLLNDSVTTSPNFSLSSSSWQYQSGFSTTDFIADHSTLEQYFSEMEDMEKKTAVSTSFEQSTNHVSFWNNQTTKTCNEVSSLLRRCAYQLAPLTSSLPVTSSPTSQGDESGSPVALQQQQDLRRRLKIEPAVLTQWNANLRLWISQTILRRLEKEFESVDDSFQRCSLSDMRIGAVGLERLKKTAQIQQVIAAIPSLVRLVPFLDLTPHQEYLVYRVKELAKGGSMSEYKWNSGGSLNGKVWEEHLPTDAALLMHLVSTYLDSQLLPLPIHPDARPFSSQYFVKSPEKPNKRCGLIIYQQQLNPPHFVLIDNDETIDVGSGRNNLFYTLILFIYLLKTKEHGMLGRVNLGPSGVNLLWVIDS